MTLLEILVKELPKHGGWPKWAAYAFKHETFKYINFYDQTGDTPHNFLSSHPSIYMGTTKYGERVTQEGYEAALAASQKPVWDGEGLPPVGSNLECHAKDGSIFKVKVVGSDGDKAILKTDRDNYFACKSDQLKPIRTEAERKREETVEVMRTHTTNYNKTDVIHAIGEIYDAIAAGKIPGIRLTDE